jgi:chemotaxis protein CheC
MRGEQSLFDRLDARGLDTLREICNIGAGHAATAFSQITGKQIDLEVPKVRVAGLSKVPQIVGGAEEPVVGLYLRILGEARGNIFMIFPADSALALLSLLGAAPPPGGAHPFEDEVAISSLKEVGNILASSYLTAINKLTGLVLIPSVPSFAYDMAGSIVDYVLIEVGRISDVALVVETVFLEQSDRIYGHVFLIPDPQSLAAILKTVG